MIPYGPHPKLRLKATWSSLLLTCLVVMVMVMVIGYASCADHTSLLFVCHHDDLLVLYYKCPKCKCKLKYPGDF